MFLSIFIYKSKAAVTCTLECVARESIHAGTGSSTLLQTTRGKKKLKKLDFPCCPPDSATNLLHFLMQTLSVICHVIKIYKIASDLP